MTKKLLPIVLIITLLITSLPMSAFAAVTDTSKSGDTQEISLHIGETKTINTDCSPSSVDFSSIDTSVATAETVESESNVDTTVLNVGENDQYNSGTIPTEEAEYTFIKYDDGTYIAVITVGEKTIYLSPTYGTNKDANLVGGFPSSTEFSTFNLEESNTDNGFYISDNNYNSEQRYIQFMTWKAMNVRAKTNTANVGTMNFFLYRKALENETSSTELPGYVKHTSGLDDIQPWYKYLIVCCYNNTYYTIRPIYIDPDLTSINGTFRNKSLCKVSTETQKTSTGNVNVTLTGNAVGTTSFTANGTTYNVTVAEQKNINVTLKIGETKYFTTAGDNTCDSSGFDTNIATAVVTQNQKITSQTANIGNDANYNADTIDINDCLYTFDKNANGTYNVHSKKDNSIYLTMAGSAQNPNQSSPRDLTITKHSIEGTFNLRTDNYLYFYRTNRKCFDRLNVQHDATSMLLFRPVKGGEVSTGEIDGFVRIRELEEIEYGEDYLIAALYNNTYYLLRPIISSSENDHVARLEIEKSDEITSTSIAFTGAGGGHTTYVVGNTTYNITVIVDKNNNMAVGDNLTFEHPDTSVLDTSNTDSNVVDVTFNNGKLNITAKGVGSTKVTIDTTTYIINVIDKFEETIAVQVGKSATITANNTGKGSSKAELNTSVATATLNSNNLEATVTGVAVGTTYLTVGNTRYTIHVVPKSTIKVTSQDTPILTGANANIANANKNKVLSALTVSVGFPYDIDFSSNKLPAGYTLADVVWGVEDNSIATIDQNGVVTGLTVGETYGFASVGGVTYSFLIRIRPGSTAENQKHYDHYITEITDSTAYCSVNCSTELFEIFEGEAIYLIFDANADTSVDYFGKSDPGYTLTFLSTTNSHGDYMALNSDDPKQTAFYTLPGAAGRNQIGTFGGEIVADMVQSAIDIECGGGMGFTKQSYIASSHDCLITIRSEKLPTIEKTVTKIMRGDEEIPLSEKTTVTTGDVIYYTLEVTQYSTTEAINYENVKIQDILQVTNTSGSEVRNVTHNGNNKLSVTKIVNGVETTEEADYTYDIETNTIDFALTNGILTNNIVYTFPEVVTYTVSNDDIGKDIANGVTLTYNYNSQYCQTGAAKLSCDTGAQAKISAFDFNAKDVVLDYGLPVQIDFATQMEQYNGITLASAEAENGTATLNNNIVTYTPNKIMTEADTVTLTNTVGGTTSFKVYPSNNIYYEETFATYGNTKSDTTGWNFTSDGEAHIQQCSNLGDAEDNYGKDTNYTGEGIGSSNGSVAVSSQENGYGDYADFTFTGTGFEVYVNCTTEEDYVSVQVYKNGKTLVKLATVATQLNTGSGTTATALHNVIGDTAYNMPVVYYPPNSLEYGTYKVRVFHTGKRQADTTYKAVGSLQLDGFRVFGTLGSENENLYQQDKEDSPAYAKLRDIVLDSMSINADDITQPLPNKNGVIKNLENSFSQVHQGGGSIRATIVNSESSAEATKDLYNNGPKSELFIAPNQSLTFKVQNDNFTSIQVGLRTMHGEVTLGGSLSGTVTSSTEQYYPIEMTTGGDGTTTVTITNNSADSNAVLSVTKLKMSGTPKSPAKTKSVDASGASILSDKSGDTAREIKFCELTAEDILPAVYSLNIINHDTGDTNMDGYVDIQDATYIQKSLIHMKNFEIKKNTEQFTCADVDGDGKVTIVDATLIQKYLNKVIDCLPFKN